MRPSRDDFDIYDEDPDEPGDLEAVEVALEKKAQQTIAKMSSSNTSQAPTGRG
jgi:hypothetical protein